MKANYRYSLHAKEEMIRREIPQDLVDKVMRNPEQIVLERNSKKAYRSLMTFDDNREYLLRVIVDDTVEPSVVVTVYRTSKIQKYWSEK